MYINYSTKREIAKGFIENIKQQFVIAFEIGTKYSNGIGNQITIFDGYLDAMVDASEIIDYNLDKECHIYRKAIRRALKYDLAWVANADLMR